MEQHRPGDLLLDALLRDGPPGERHLLLLSEPLFKNTTGLQFGQILVTQDLTFKSRILQGPLP